MTETTTPTDEVVDQDSSDIRDESLLDNDSEQDSAVEPQNDTDSSESNDSDSDSSSSTDDSSDEDKGLAKFAKSQGFEDFDALSDDAKKALRIARKQVQKDRKDLEDKASKRKIDDEVKELYKPDENDGTSEALLKEVNQIKARDYTRSFWDENPDDKKYEPYMAQVLQEEIASFQDEEEGKESARRLAQNLPRLLREAKFKAGAFDSDAARDAGRREERERLKKIQEGGADSAHASQTSAASSKKLTREAIENMSDEEYTKRRAEIDAAIIRGDLY